MARLAFVTAASLGDEVAYHETVSAAVIGRMALPELKKYRWAGPHLAG